MVSIEPRVVDIAGISVIDAAKIPFCRASFCFIARRATSAACGLSSGWGARGSVSILDKGRAVLP